MDSDSNQLVGSIIPEYKFSEFKDTKIIGEGGEAIVYKGRHATDEKYFAIKKMLRMNKKEAELLIKHSEHENIVKVYGLLIEEGSSKNHIGYFMEFMENGSLSRIIHSIWITYTMRQFYLWIREAAKGLKYLHRNNIMHRDIKPANILIGNSLDVLKISDFGLAKSLDKTISSITGGIGTISYMSPEVINYQKYSFPSDIYALSITIWEMLHRKKPYEEFSDKSLYWISNQITEKNKRPSNKRPATNGDAYSWFRWFQINNTSNDSTTNLDYLLSRGWHADPNMRPNLSEFIYFARINLEESDTSQILDVGTNPETVQPSRKQIKNSVMILGGLVPNGHTDSICIFNSKQNKWNDLNLKLPRNLSGHGSVMINDEIYIFGENMEWIKLANMNERKSGIGNSSVVFDDEIWVFGGWDGRTFHKTVEKYNPKTDSWTVMSEMNQEKCWSAVSIINGKFYVSGGYYINYLNTIEVYDPEEKKWEIFCEMPFVLCSHVSVVDGTDLIIIGGDKSHGLTDEVWKINVSDPEKKWDQMSQLNQKRFGHGAIKLSDGLMVIGGASKNRKLDSVEIFDGCKWTEKESEYLKWRSRSSFIPLMTMNEELFLQQDNLLKR